MRFHEKLKKLITVTGLSQAKIGVSLDVHQTHVSKWVRDKSKPNVYQAKQLADIFGVSLDYLADDAQDEPSASSRLADDENVALDLYRDLKERHSASTSLRLLTLLATYSTAEALQRLSLKTTFESMPLKSTAETGGKKKGNAR